MICESAARAPRPLARQDEAPLKEGDKVKYRSHKGELLSIRGKDATIVVDGLKMRVPLSQLKKRGDTPQIKVKPKPKYCSGLPKKSSTTGMPLKLGLSKLSAAS